MTTYRTYNVKRVDYLPLAKQKELIKAFWKNKLVSNPVICKDDKRYITFVVRI